MPVVKKALHFLFIFRWERKWNLLFVGLMLFQYAEWFSEYWLRETEIIVKVTLGIVFLIEFFQMRPAVLRLALEGTGVIAVLFAVLGSPRWDSQEGFISRLPEWFFAHYAQFSPFLWFAFGAWLVYLYYSWWLTQKWRTAAFMIGSVLLFAVADSFSPFYLWDQVAVLIFSGLSLLVVQHFSHLKEGYPESWARLRGSVFFVLSPFLLILLICSLAVLAARDVRPMLTDPYTAWKHWRGEEVRLPGKGLAEGVFGNLSSLSGYSRDDRELGGEFLFDYTPVMEIVSTHRSYWRGETRIHYNGKGWEPYGEAFLRGSESVSVGGNLTGSSPSRSESQKTIRVEQTVKMLGNYRYPVLFHAYAPVRLEGMLQRGRELNPDLVRWNGNESVLLYHPSPRFPYPDTYMLVSEIPVIDEAALRQAKPDPNTLRAMVDYLQLPDTLPERVIRLARDITQNGTNDYDKVKKIEEYLSLNYRYTNQPDMSKAKSGDFVDQFLFEVQEGYCDYFSTSMVILARAAGIPARWVKGYAPGTLEGETPYFGFPPETEQNIGGTFTVTNADAHSWVEVYFEGYGWIPFEPTPGFDIPYYQFVSENQQNPSLSENVQEQESASSPLSVHGGIRKGAPILALGFAAALLAVLFRKGLIRLFLPARVSPSSMTIGQKAVWETEKWLKRIRRKGLKKGENETLREACMRWSGMYPSFRNEFEQILVLFEKAKYSSHELQPEEFRKMKEMMKHIVKNLRRKA